MHFGTNELSLSLSIEMDGVLILQAGGAAVWGCRTPAALSAGARQSMPRFSSAL